MDKQTLLALIVWAIDIDGFSLPFTKAWEMFQRDAEKMHRTFTNPSHPEDYCPGLVDKKPLDVMVEYTLFYAKMHVQSGIRDYGKLNRQITKFIVL